MAFQGNNHLLNWRRRSKRKTPGQKMQLKMDDIDEWMKRVEMASEFAVSEVLTSGANSRAMALQSAEQLQDHDDAYSEAQALLSDWMSSKLRLELEMDEEDDPAAPAVPTAVLPAFMDYSSFDELYNHLAEEEEGKTVSSFLQELMDRELLDPGTAQDLLLDLDQARRRTRDPSVTMEARHRQVRETRARRDAERERLRRAQEARRAALEEARQREREAEARRREEARRGEALVQKEMGRLRRQMEEQKALEQRGRQKEREKLDRQKAAVLPPSAGPSFSTYHPPAEQSQSRLHILNLQCLQRPFSGWYSVVLERRLQLGRAAALCDWKRSLRAWRAWRTLVWAAREHREREATEEELRTEHRRDQLAAGGDRRRLLRRCFSTWQLWWQSEKGQRELLAQQEQTRSKMAALISAASTGRLRGPEAPAQGLGPPGPTGEGADPPGVPDRVGTVRQKKTDVLPPAPSSGRQGDSPAVPPLMRPPQPWQVTRRHAAVSACERRQAQRRRGAGGGADQGPRSEPRHAAQQHTIALQRKLLREQQEQILLLQKERCLLEARGAPEQRAQGRTGDQNSWGRTPTRNAANQQRPLLDPVVMAMEERARLRLERRREVEEMRRKKEEEKLAQMKAEEEERRRQEQEERREEERRRREEGRLQREREEQQQQRVRSQQALQTTARHHHQRSLLLRRGLAPWQRLLRLKRGHEQLAVRHHMGRVLSTGLRAWHHWTSASLSEKQAAADQLNRQLLLRQAVACWRRLVECRARLEERAQDHHRATAQRRVLRALLALLTRERLLQWDRLEEARQHSSRRVLRRCLRVWVLLPGRQREEREKEARREQLRRRVEEVLPDFRCSPLGSF
ncbi:coiled-coil domain-containing protein 191 [Gadus chalcogrammus]|uniref:coiled-coil domain-containing protein 191 n=1 Tax=Gadus chalcogrammus TaxID=1042646 RepID=UPI0024C48D7A|nr:coiled-coil domain-containing protein 191 [Gadus chalcogrammus]